MQQVTPEAIREALAQPLPRVPTTAAYGLRVVLVAATLVALQALYVALIVAVFALTVAYTALIVTADLPINFFTVLAYIGPPFVGLVAIFFLLKPLLIGLPPEPEPPVVRRKAEPLLFEFVERLCSAMGARRPARIQVDLAVNAAAAVDGWRGLFRGRLVLRIGLPLAAGTTLTEFAGILAHEFGHLSQGAGIRSYFLIQSIQGWFARVVHQRDRMDAWLERRRRYGDLRIRLLATVAQAVVDVSRLYLTLLMKLGLLVSSALSREMEFDADRYETALVGMAVFRETCHKLPLLRLGESLAWHDAARLWQSGGLPDNMPALIARHAASISADGLLAQRLSAKTGWFDSHPCLSDRIASSQRFGAAGVLYIDAPATALFADFDSLARRVSAVQFERTFGRTAEQAQRVPARDIVVDAS